MGIVTAQIGPGGGASGSGGSGKSRPERIAADAKQKQERQGLKQFKVRVRADFLERLHAVAADKGLSTSGLVTAILEDAIGDGHA